MPYSHRFLVSCTNSFICKQNGDGRSRTFISSILHVKILQAEQTKAENPQIPMLGTAQVLRPSLAGTVTVVLWEQAVHRNMGRSFSLEQQHRNGLVWMESLTSETSSSLSAMPVGPCNSTEKQVSHDDLVVVNKANLFPDFTLKRQKGALPKWAFSTVKTDWNPKYAVHINNSYTFYTWQYISRIVPSFSEQSQCWSIYFQKSLLPSTAGTIILTQLSPASNPPRNKVGAVWVCVGGWKIP